MFTPLEYLIRIGFREEAAKAVVQKGPRDSDVNRFYKYLCEVCDAKLRNIDSLERSVKDLCVDLGLDLDRMGMYVDSGVINGPKTLKAYVTLEFIRMSLETN